MLRIDVRSLDEALQVLTLLCCVVEDVNSMNPVDALLSGMFSRFRRANPGSGRGRRLGSKYDTRNTERRAGNRRGLTRELLVSANQRRTDWGVWRC